DAVIQRLDSTHISCRHLPSEWPRTDEWYNYRDIQTDLNILLNLDESSYAGGTNGDNHPIAWYHEFDGGRAFYTGGGHTEESFSEEDFLKHLWGGIEYAVGDKPVDYNRETVAPEENRFQKVVLEDNLDEPMEMVMLPDRNIIFIERKGDIKLFDQVSGETKTVTHLDVHTKHEDGLLGIALDPEFTENRWLYLFYSPPGDIPKQHISRFDFIDGQVDLSSEKVLLEIGTQREECCHSGGCLEFGPDGNLYFSAGDNTNPFASDGYSPSDERPGRSPWDAQKSSSNTNDLRGKVSRIHPEPDGTYSIPDGNLFLKDGSQGRPEIYAMGCRNPFRISIDQRTGFLYWGDVGPDAGKDSVGRGPRGHDEVNQARNSGFFGWPYFIGDNKAYHEYDFARKRSLGIHNPERPVNNSPNNTGVEELPPATPAFIWYPYAESTEFPLVGTGGRNAMAGPVFYIDDYPENDLRYPAYYDGKLFTYDWIRGWIMAVSMNEQGDFVSMERFLPGQKFSNPIDIIMSPDGDMYILEYGTAWFARNKDARLVHLKYIKGNRQPVAHAQVETLAGAIPFEARFTSHGTADPDGEELKYHWSFGDGGTSIEENPIYTFNTAGNFKVELTVTDKDGLRSSDVIQITAGNDPPQLAWEIEGNRSFFWPGQQIKYQVNVTDKEDGNLGTGIEPSDVIVSISYLDKGSDINIISMGHEALAASSRFIAGKNIIDQSDCKACHFEDRKSIGPTFIEIAEKYESQADAVSYLSDKIINGGGGVWGVNAMAAHPQHSNEEAEKMVAYILSLANEEDKGESVPVSGTYTFSETMDHQEGSYILMASYTDRGAGKVEPLSKRAMVRLRSPLIDATTYDTAYIARKFTLSADQAAQAGFSEPFDILVAADKGFVGFKQIDLSGITMIQMEMSTNSAFTGGGMIQVMADGPDGEVLGQQEVPTDAPDDKLSLSIPIENTVGHRDLYFTFAGNEGKPVCTLLSLAFKSADPL
ncbi:MAG: PKD domain-containing protein, partial [Saprospiraceae bacterium]|nr:PKD domain-containing protein [Saprospiraceae bacterium]